MIETAANAAVLINYDLRARGRLGVCISRGLGCASPGEAADAVSSKTLNGGGDWGRAKPPPAKPTLPDNGDAPARTRGALNSKSAGDLPRWRCLLFVH